LNQDEVKIRKVDFPKPTIAMAKVGVYFAQMPYLQSPCSKMLIQSKLMRASN
jgi:hypothetical protein